MHVDTEMIATNKDPQKQSIVRTLNNQEREDDVHTEGKLDSPVKSEEVFRINSHHHSHARHELREALYSRRCLGQVSEVPKSEGAQLATG